MSIFEGKSPTEKKKIIAAGVLSVVALLSLYLAFGGSFSSGAAKVSVSPTPRPSSSPSAAAADDFKLPSASDQNFDYQTTEVVYNPAAYSAPDAGRNIFAFYEPPPPCRDCPTPIATPPPPKTPVPTPTPEMIVSFANPQSVYAGSKDFRLEISGDKFTPDSRIYISQQILPTNFVSAQRLVADVPAALVAQEGPRQIIIQSADGKKWSNQVMLNVQAPPKPAFQYIGMIARKRYNNDMGSFQEPGKTAPTSARLNDIIGGRFRLVSISAGEAVFEDVSLGFRHRLPIYRPEPGSAVSTGAPNRGNFPNDGFSPYNPNPSMPPQQSIPGIPDNIPRYIPPPNAQPQQQQPPSAPPKQDVDDDNGDD